MDKSSTPIWVSVRAKPVIPLLLDTLIRARRTLGAWGKTCSLIVHSGPPGPEGSLGSGRVQPVRFGIRNPEDSEREGEDSTAIRAASKGLLATPSEVSYKSY